MGENQTEKLVGREHDDWVKRHLGLDPQSYVLTDPDPDMVTDGNQSIDPNAGQPNQSVDPTVQPPASGVEPSSNPYAGSPLSDAWKAGYADGFAQPDETQRAPASYGTEMQTVYSEGVLAGQETAKVRQPNQSVAPPAKSSEQGQPDLKSQWPHQLCIRSQPPHRLKAAPTAQPQFSNSAHHPHTPPPPLFFSVMA